MDLQTSVLVTDLYQLTMLQGYFEYGMEETAVFEFFVRDLPDNRNFLLAAGLEQALTFLEHLRFTEEELDFLEGTQRFTPAFLDHLKDFRFTGDVHAMPEGTAFFPNEPILRVTAPLPQAQLVESRLINLLHFETLIASKAVRCVLAAPGKLMVDFGLRRAHGAEAGLLAARASYLAGMQGTSTVIAQPLFGIPIFGTMAHSFIEAHGDETEAFEHFAHAQPGNVVLLIDTYDTEEGARKVVALAPRLKAQGIPIKGVRIDSGDLAEHAKKVRRILDEGGLRETIIFASGNLDEYALKALMEAKAPIDGFGVGTRMDTSADAPYLDSAYKLQEYAGKPRRKRSEGKATWPGRKQVYRHYRGGYMERDTLTLEGDPQEGEPLIEKVMEKGRRLSPPPSLDAIRERVREQLERLPPPLKAIEKQPPYPVHISKALQDL
ncbi:MAG: nicotinate phosphoribosyltransferase, partial [Gammaproteobacteria bacterium]